MSIKPDSDYTSGVEWILNDSDITALFDIRSQRNDFIEKSRNKRKGFKDDFFADCMGVYPYYIGSYCERINEISQLFKYSRIHNPNQSSGNSKKTHVLMTSYYDLPNSMILESESEMESYSSLIFAVDDSTIILNIRHTLDPNEQHYSYLDPYEQITQIYVLNPKTKFVQDRIEIYNSDSQRPDNIITCNHRITSLEDAKLIYPRISDHLVGDDDRFDDV